jgi:MFS family permease
MGHDREVPPQPAAPPWRELFVWPLGRTTIGIVLLETVAAVQVLVTVAVLPAVVHDLGGLRLYGVALSASVLASAVALPVAARLAEGLGLYRLFLSSVALFAIGTLLVVLAPGMGVFIVGRLAEGAAAGGQYAVLLVVFARAYRTALRPRMIAVWTMGWTIPGLLAPAYGGILAATIGWRWAFVTLLPLLVPPVVLLAPALRQPEPLPDQEEAEADLASWGALLGLGLGSVLILVALALGSTWGLVLGVVALVPTVLALRAILPAGSFTARAGMPAVIAAAFLSSAAFFAADGFIPAMLTGVRGESLVTASIVVTVGTLAWVAGTWWQSRIVLRMSAARLVALGTCAVLAGVAGVAATDLGAPVLLAYVSWAVAGVGMGVVFPTVTLLATELAQRGHEIVGLAQYQLVDALGAAAGPGLGGGALSFALVAGLSLRAGLLAGLVVAFGLGVVLLGVSPRLSDAGRLAAGG